MTDLKVKVGVGSTKTKKVIWAGGENDPYVDVVALADGDGNVASAQHPISVDGDRVYVKDLDTTNSSIGDFSGSITDLFDSRTSTVTTETDNPSLIVALESPILNHEITLVAASGNFKNVTIVAKDASGATLETIDDSANNTPYTANKYHFINIDTWCVVVISFTTTDTVTLSFLNIPKSRHVDAHLVALKPDGEDVHIGATAGGNLKGSLEEFDESFNALPLPVGDYGLWVSRGLVSNMGKVNKYGGATDGVQTTPTDIWDRADAVATQQIWVPPTQARIHTIYSTSDQDSGPGGVIAAGTGMRSCRIWYLPDWDTPEAFEDVVMDGTNGIAMINAAVIIHRKKIIPSLTSYNINAGNITAVAAVDATITSQINVGNGQTLMAIYGIPSTQRFCMTKYLVNAHNTGNPSTVTETDFTLLINERPDLNPSTFINKSNLGLIATGTTAHPRDYDPPYCVDGPAIMKFQAISTLADTEAVAEFDGYLETL